MSNKTNWAEKACLMALGSIFTIIGLMLSPITAQQDKDNKFGHIECASLSINLSEGEADGLIICDANDNELVNIGISENGGMIAISGHSEAFAIMGFNKHGTPIVGTWDEDGLKRATLHRH